MTSDPASANPNAVLEAERWYLERHRPLRWIVAIVRSAWNLSISLVVAVAVVHFGRRAGGPPIYLYAFAALLILMGLGSAIQRVYRTWAKYSVSLDVRRDVFSMPVERVLLVLTLALVTIVASLLILTGSVVMIASAVALLAVVGRLAVRRYQRAVARPPVDPSQVAPVTVDPAEVIEVTVAGIMRAGGRWDGGFGQHAFPWTPASDRAMNRGGQNALIGTDQRLYFIFVPMGLGDQTVARSQGLEFAFADDYIRAKLDEMLRTMSLAEIYASHRINFAVNIADIARAEFRARRNIALPRMSLLDRQGGRLTVTVRRAEGMEQLRDFCHRRSIQEIET